jgi:ectoine hydroxylase-related dioxygenase (phytanoyl-CoA dioxygenase family)
MIIRQLMPQALIPVARYVNQSCRAQIRQIQYSQARWRRAQHNNSKAIEHKTYPEVMEALDRNGFAIIPNVFSESVITALRDQLEAALAAKIVYPIYRNPQDTNALPHLTAEELDRGEAYVAQHSNIAYIHDPLANCPTSLNITFADVIFDIAAGFYGCPAAITGVNLMKSFVNDLPDAAFNLFHVDCQSARFIKFFVYMDDVDTDTGPFSIVPGSHRNKPLIWHANNKRTLEQVENVYGKGAVKQITAKAGDLVIANTTGVHRAQKPQKHARRALMINTGIHPIERAIGSEPVILEQDYGSLTPKQKTFADFLQVVPANSLNRKSARA